MDEEGEDEGEEEEKNEDDEDNDGNDNLVLVLLYRGEWGEMGRHRQAPREMNTDRQFKGCAHI